MSATAPTTGHLRQVDVVRVVTFVCVVVVHAISHTAVADVPSGYAGTLFHFTREVFFLLTGFVLFHANYRKPLVLRTFWARRMLLVGVPYVTWTVVYFVTQPAGAQPWPQRLGYDLISGRATYTLYFLLVSLQIYLLFPALRWAIRRTEGHHGLLLAGVSTYQVTALWSLHATSVTGGLVGEIVRYADTLLPTYALFVLAGALAAVHLQRFQQLVDRFRLVTFGVLVLALGLVSMVYLIEVDGGHKVGYAAAVLQPVMVPWSLAVGLALYATGSRWAAGQPGRPAAVLSEGARISFGVYLIHPLILNFLSDHWLGVGHSVLDAPWSTIVLVAVTVALSAISVEVLQRTPLSLALTGRPRNPPPHAVRVAWS